VGSAVWWVLMPVVVVFMVIALFRTFRQQSDGKGPAVQWFPRALRPRVNRLFAQRGWPEPYDESLDKIPRGER